MPLGKPQAKLTAEAASSNTAHSNEHTYAHMDVTTSGSMKRKDPPATPTKNTTPPVKVKTHQEPSVDTTQILVKAIEKLTEKIDIFGAQLKENNIMVVNISKVVEMNAAEIKECKENVQAVKKEVPRLTKENKDLKEKLLELERCNRRRNLKIHGLKEKDEERIRDVVIEILSKIAPQIAPSLDYAVDTAHRLGRRLEGKHRQIMIQFTTRHHRDVLWKLSKNCKICKDMGIHFKQDFCKADQEARAAAWPRMEQARAAGKNVYYKGHVGYINGNRVEIV